MTTPDSPLISERQLELGLMRAGGLKRFLGQTSAEIAEALIRQQQLYTGQAPRTPVQTWKIESIGKDFSSMQYGQHEYIDCMTPYTAEQIAEIARCIRQYIRKLDNAASLKLAKESKIALVERAEVTDPVFDHDEALDAEAECKTLPFPGVDSAVA
jgi:hypothetical protein